MKTAQFTNFTNETFTGYWDGKPKTFKPGESKFMPDYLAKHLAKHLVNRELLRKDEGGNLIYKDGEKFTSPKRPEDVPLYMELFGKAYHSDEEDDEDSTELDDVDVVMESENKNRSTSTETIDEEDESFEGEPEEL